MLSEALKGVQFCKRVKLAQRMCVFKTKKSEFKYDFLVGKPFCQQDSAHWNEFNAVNCSIETAVCCAPKDTSC